MKCRKFTVIAMLFIIGIAGAIAGLSHYSNASTKTLETSFGEALSILPSDCQFVFGINVRQVVSSPAYERFRQKQLQQNNRELEEEFIEKTGLDPARDISCILVAARSVDLPNPGTPLERTQGKGVVVITGNFNKEAIAAFIRSKVNLAEMQYEGEAILVMPEGSANTVDKGIVFLTDHEIALGDLESLKAVVDIRMKGNTNILFNPGMASLIDSIQSDEMLWFAGDTSHMFANAPLNTPLGQNIGAIQSIVGTLSVTDFVKGNITATAVNEESAARLADVGRGFVAFAQLAGDKNPDLKMLVSGLSILQDSTQVSVVLNFPTYLLEKLENLRKQPEQIAGK
jgi:hypothetical protein